LEQVLKEEELQHIPFIVISAEDELDSVVRCIEMGAVDYLAKPFNAVLLRARINASLDKKRARDREAALFNELQQRYQELEQMNVRVQEQAHLLKELSIRDALTGLYNRRHFDEQAAKTFAQTVRFNHPLSVMIGDIDFFKKINDNFSHAIGDDVLRRVAHIMQTNTRQSDIVARYGGEEFVIAFCETPLEQAVNHCEKVRQLIENYAWRDVHPDLHVTMSMGLCADLTTGSLEKMLAAADEKLYAAKSSGRNRVCA
jgi:diguanylate cyclase (GGDEF)-like protein